MKKIIGLILLFQIQLAFGQSPVYHYENDEIRYVLQVYGEYYNTNFAIQYVGSSISEFNIPGETSPNKVASHTARITKNNGYIDYIKEAFLLKNLPSQCSYRVNNLSTSTSNQFSFVFEEGNNSKSSESSTSGTFGASVNIIPLYTISSIPERFRKLGEHLSVNIIQKDNSAFNTINFDNTTYNQNFCFEIKLKSENDLNYRQIYVSPFLFHSSYNLNYSDISNAFGSINFKGQECQIRLRYKIENHYFYSNPKSFYYLDEVPISISAPQQPKCVGEAVNVEFKLNEISGLSGETNLNYLYSINEYSKNLEDACECPGAIDKVIPDPSKPTQNLYLKRVLISDNLPVLSNNLNINQSLTKGFYRIKAYLLSGETMYYPAERIVVITDPPQFQAALAYKDTFGTYFIRACDSLGTLSASFSNGVIPYTFYNGSQKIDSLSKNGDILLPYGTYHLQIKDANKCIATITGITGDINFTKPEQIYVNTSLATTIDVTCYQSNSGSISVPVAGGILGYRTVKLDGDSFPFKYNPQNSILTISNLPAKSNYSLINIRDTSGCVSLNFTLNKSIAQPEPLTISHINYNTPLCSDNLPSIASITTTGGNLNHQYWTRKNNWSSTNIGSPVFNSQDTVTIFIKDNKDCMYKHPVQTMPVVPAPIVTKVIENIPATCNSASNGKIRLKISGGTPLNSSYDITFSGNLIKNDTLIRHNLSSGTYPITILDANSCPKDTSIYIGLTANPFKIKTLESVNSSCEMVNNGRIALEVTPGDRNYSPFSYSISGPLTKTRSFRQVTTPIDSLQYGTYTIHVSDSAFCSKDSTFTIGLDPLRLKKPVLTSYNTVCPGVDMGKITGTVTDGYPTDGKFQVKLYDSNDALIKSRSLASISFDTLGVGSYKIVVEDDKGCETSENASVHSNSTPVHFQYLDFSNQHCDEVVNGFIKIKGITKPGHSISQMVNISGPLPVTLANEALAELSPLTAGTYKIRAVDNVGCLNDTSIQIINIHNDPKIAIQILDSLACESAQNGAIKVSATQKQNTGNFNYNLVGSGLKTDSLVAHFKNLTLRRGTSKYTLTVTDKIGCASDTTFEFLPIKNPVRIASWSIDTASCIRAQNAAVQLQAAGSWGSNPGYFYVLNLMDTLKGANRTFFNQKTGGSNKVFLFDKYGCFDATPTFAFPVRSDSLNIELLSWIHPACPEQTTGSISVRAYNGKPYSDGFNYSVFKTGETIPYKTERGPSAKSLSGLAKGNYYVEVTDKDNCRAVTSGKMLVEPDTIEFSVSPGYVAAKGTSTGWINASATGGNGKYQVEWYTHGMVKPENLLLSQTTLLNSGVRDLSAGLYLVRVRDTASCKFWNTEWLEQVVNVPEPEKALSLTAAKKQVSCFGRSDGVFTLQASGGWGPQYLYGNISSQVNLQSPVFTNISKGAYTYFVKDTSGTVTSYQVDMTEPDLLTASLGTTQNVSCYGGTNGQVSLLVHGGNRRYQISRDNVTWIPGTVLSGLPSGNYTFFVRDSLLCATQIPAAISQPAKIAVTDTTIVDTQCKFKEGSIETTIDGGVPGYSFIWSDESGNLIQGTTRIDSLYSGQYSLVITDANNCPAEFTFYINDVTDLEVDTIITKPVSCWMGTDGTALAMVQKGFPPYTITWPGNVTGTSVTGLQSGTYLLKVYDSEGCKIFRNFSIGTPDSLWLDTDRLAHPLCFGITDGLLQVSANGGTPTYEYSWNTGRTRNSISSLDTGVYTVLVTDKNKCQKLFSYHLQYQEKITSTLPGELTICKANTYPVNAGTFDAYSWKKNGQRIGTDSILYVSSPGTYRLDFRDYRGCKGTDSIKISQTDNLLKAQFLMASAIRQNDTLIIFEASDPLPDSIQVLPSAGLKEVKSERFYKYFVARDTGIYELTLISYAKGCQDIVSKKVLVLPAGTPINDSRTPVSRLEKLFVYPNPSEGDFRVEVKLTETADINLRIVSFATGKTELIRNLKGNQNYLEYFSMPYLTPGFYLLNVQVGDEMRNIKLVIR